MYSHLPPSPFYSPAAGDAMKPELADALLAFMEAGSKAEAAAGARSGAGRCWLFACFCAALSSNEAPTFRL